MITKLTHPVSGELKRITLDEMLALADESIYEQLTRLYNTDKYTGLVCFEVLDMCSSQLGHRTFCVIGGDTFPNVESLVNGNVHLGDVPSRMAYPKVYCLKDEGNEKD